MSAASGVQDMHTARLQPAGTVSSYATYRDGRLELVAAPEIRPGPIQTLVHDQLRALILSAGFPCVGAKSALHRGSYRMAMYGELGSPEASDGLVRDLHIFVEEQATIESEFTSFITCFAGPAISGEETFETLLWQQLQELHERDREHCSWDPSVSSDPADPQFSFSIAGCAFFVVGLHPAASRFARRFAWPTLVFNRHDQFDRLRAEGRFAPLQAAIRVRDAALQGYPNPMIQDFGRCSEVRQYSGRHVGDSWSCPFHAHPQSEDA